MFQRPFSDGFLGRPRAARTEELREIASRSKAAGYGLDELRARLDRTLRVNQALWELLKRQHGWKDEQLEHEIARLEAADAPPLAGNPVCVCKDCGRTVSRRHGACMYCGGAGFFEPPSDAPRGADGA